MKAFSSAYVPPRGFNRGRFADAVVDELLSREQWQAAVKRAHDQLPYIPLWYEGQFAALHSDIMGYFPKPDGNWDDLATVQRSATIAHHVH